MFVTLVAVIVALVLGHVAPSLAASVRHFDWYDTWLRWLDGRLAQNELWRGRYGIAFGLVPPLLAVALFQIALDAPLLGLVGLLFGIVVLFYAWGPRDLDLDVDAIVEARDPLARREAAARLSPLAADDAEDARATVLDGPALVEAVFRNALQRWFGVLFWFLLLGPFGALLYRLVALAAEGEPRRSAAAGSRGRRAEPADPARLAGGAVDDAVDGTGRQLRHRRRRVEGCRRRFTAARYRLPRRRRDAPACAASSPTRRRSLPRKASRRRPASSRNSANCRSCATR